MKILVTGGAGFIGSHVVERLLENGHKVSIIDNLSSGKNLNKRAKLYEQNIQDDVDEIFSKEKPDYVIHLAAQIVLGRSIRKPKFDADANIIGSLNIIEACMKHNVKKIIFASSAAVYDLNNTNVPTSEDEAKGLITPYGIAKITVERYLYFFNTHKGLDYTVLRFPNAYGPRQRTDCEGGVIARFCNMFAGGDKATIFGDGKQTRDFIYVKDLARAVDFAMNNNVTGSFNIGTGEETSILDLHNTLNEVTDANIEPVFGPAAAGDARRSCFDITKIKRKGWQPKYNLKESLKETIESIKN